MKEKDYWNNFMIIIGILAFLVFFSQLTSCQLKHTCLNMHTPEKCKGVLND